MIIHPSGALSFFESKFNLICFVQCLVYYRLVVVSQGEIRLCCIFFLEPHMLHNNTQRLFQEFIIPEASP